MSIFNRRSMFIFSLLFASFTILNAFYYHDEDISGNEVWLADSLHYVNDNITILEGASITIQEGCEIYMNWNLTVNGKLYVNGDSWFRVEFRESGDLIFDDADTGSSINYTDFNAADLTIRNCSDSLGITVSNSSFSNGSDLLIENNSNPGISDCDIDGTTFKIYDSNPLVSNIQISNTNVGLRVADNAAPVITDLVSDDNSSGVVVQNGAAGSFTNCSFENNSDDGLKAINSGNPIFEQCSFSNNFSNGINITAENGGESSATFNECVADSNSNYGVYLLQAGGSSASAVITDCEIKDNYDSGIYAKGDITISSTEISGNDGYGLYVPAETDVGLSISNLTVANNDTTAFSVPVGLVSDIPDFDSMSIYDNNPDGIDVTSDYLNENAVWNSNPIYLCGQLGINQDFTLQLPANTIIYCRQNSKIKVQGSIIADSVWFGPDKELDSEITGYWQGIFLEGNLQSRLNSCSINNAGLSNMRTRPASIVLDYVNYADSMVILNNVHIEDSGGDGIYIDHARPIITNCQITFSDSCGIFINEEARPYIDSCYIAFNGQYGIKTNPNYSAYNYGTLKNSEIRDHQTLPLRIPPEMLKDLSTLTLADNQSNTIIEVCGGQIVSDATWSGNFEYHLLERVEAQSDGGNLIIEPGSILKFDDNVRMRIKTSINAVGTSNEHILFTSLKDSPSPGDWQGIRLYECLSDCYFTYCDIEYASNEYQDASMKFEYSNVYLEHCDISYSGSAGVNVSSGSDVYITNCDIHHNAAVGVDAPWFWDWNKFHISYSNIYNNGSYAIRGPASTIKYIKDEVMIDYNEIDGINIRGSWQLGGMGSETTTGTWFNHNVPYYIDEFITVSDGDTLTITAGNTFFVNDEKAIGVDGTLIAEGNADSLITFNRYPDSESNWQFLKLNVPDNVCSLKYCSFTNGGYYEETRDASGGMLMFDNTTDKVLLENCVIDSSASSGIYLLNDSQPQIINSQIINNTEYGIYLNAAGDNNVSLGIELSQWNDIYGNGGYEIYNNNNNDITAEYIYWGTTTEADISSKLFTGRGDIDYTPWTNAAHDEIYPQTGIDVPQNVVMEIVGSEIILSWDAVGGATSYKIYSSDNPIEPYETWNYEDEVIEISWSESILSDKKFYYVTAVTTTRVKARKNE